MKYEQQFKTKVHPPWRLNYMAYSELKGTLKQKSDHWTAQDEKDFNELIESDFTKVCSFLQQQLDTIVTNTVEIEKQHYQQQNTLSSRVTDLIFDLHDINRYFYANKTGFDKMVKKHDRYTKYIMRPHYESNMVTAMEAYSHQLNTLMTRLCYLYDLCRQQQSTFSTLPSPSTVVSMDRHHYHHQQHNSLSLQQQCTTFWVHPDNINEVKAICLFNLPILPITHPHDSMFMKSSQGASGKLYQQDNNVTTVYLDNSHFDIYRSRVAFCNDKGGLASLSLIDSANTTDTMVRCRWYGDNTTKMYLQRQHLKNKKLNQQQCAMNGIPVSSYSKRWQQVLEDTSKERGTFHDIRQSIRQQQLEPMFLTSCQRTTFYQQGQEHNSSMYLHMDVNIQFDRSISNADKATSHKKQQQQQYPTATQLTSKTVADTASHRFPYAVLSIQHMGTMDVLPHWLSELLSSHLVYAVPRFSTFVHAIYQLHGRDRLTPLAPWWFTLIDKEIRKSPCNKVGLSRTASAQPLINGQSRELIPQQKPNQPLFPSASLPPPPSTTDSSTIPLTTLSSETKGQHISILFDPTLRTDQHQEQPLEQLEKHTQMDDHDNKWYWWRNKYRHRQQRRRPALTTSASSTRHCLLPDTAVAEKCSTGSSIDISSKATPSLPPITSRKNMNRITEPKTYFANERTFISWLQFCAVLLTVALTLFNHGDLVSKWMGTALLGMTCLLAFYALGRFQYRSWQLKTRRYVLRYDDVVGPSILCSFLVLAMMVNFYLRLPLF